MQKYLLLITLLVIASCSTSTPSSMLVQRKDTATLSVTPSPSPFPTPSPSPTPTPTLVQREDILSPSITPIPSPSPLPTATLTSEQKCKLPFQDLNEVRTFFSNRNVSGKTWVRIISVLIIGDGENYLNNCTDFELPLVSQSEALKVLNQSLNGYPSDVSVTELIDWNDDGVDELVFHTILTHPISFVFQTDQITKEWYGTMIWPPITFCCEFEHPHVYLLELIHSLNYPLIAVEGEFSGADHDRNILTIWRFKDENPQLMLKIALSNWCGQPNKWEITPKGEIIVPAAERTKRCDARKELMIELQNDKFEIKNLATLGDSYLIPCNFFSDWDWQAELQVCN